jgi:NAD-dependent deacetylase
MFHENLPEHALERARNEAERCDVLISIGTSNQVWPAAELPGIALRQGATVIIINPDFAGQPLDARIIRIQSAAGIAVPAIVAGLTAKTS